MRYGRERAGAALKNGRDEMRNVIWKLSAAALTSLALSACGEEIENDEPQSAAAATEAAAPVAAPAAPAAGTEGAPAAADSLPAETPTDAEKKEDPVENENLFY